jgi:hypothetical protein
LFEHLAQFGRQAELHGLRSEECANVIALSLARLGEYLLALELGQIQHHCLRVLEQRRHSERRASVYKGQGRLSKPKPVLSHANYIAHSHDDVFETVQTQTV